MRTCSAGVLGSWLAFTLDRPTSAGSLSWPGARPPHDAVHVPKRRETGAIRLATSNKAEFAWRPFEMVGSLPPGYTRNPRDLPRVPVGSQDGTAAAVAANFGSAMSWNPACVTMEAGSGTRP